jgi:hypothetical protein
MQNMGQNPESLGFSTNLGENEAIAVLGEWRMFASTMKALGFAAAMMLPSLASAATVSLVYDGGTANGWVTITSAPDGVAAATLPWSVGAHGFNMHDTTGQMDNFVAFCLDITHYLGNGDYMTTDTPFSNSYGLDGSQFDRVQALFDANYATVMLGNAAQAAGFQVALWNALYDTDWSASGGIFAVIDGTSGAQAQANDYLLAAQNYTGGHRYSMTFLESLGRSQNLVTVAPIPLPATALMLLGALGGLGALRRRNRAA